MIILASVYWRKINFSHYETFTNTCTCILKIWLNHFKQTLKFDEHHSWIPLYNTHAVTDYPKSEKGIAMCIVSWSKYRDTYHIVRWVYRCSLTNNQNGFQREIKINGHRLEEVENLKYLGAIISNKGSKPEILSRIAQTTAALSRLKIIWRDKNISLASKVKLMRMLILSTFLYACESWTLTAEIERRIQAHEMRCYRKTSEHFLQRPCDERGGSQQNPKCNWSAWGSPNHGKEMETQMVWPHLKILWHGEDSSARDSERSQERKTEEEMGR